MKKILYILPVATAILFTSCEDRGTTTEVARSNDDENVNPAHLGQYNWPGLSPGTQATPVPADQLVREYYLTTPEQYYKFNATRRMGGMTKETATDMPAGTDTNAANKNQGPTMAPGSTTADGQATEATKTGKKPTDTQKKRLTPDE